MNNQWEIFYKLPKQVHGEALQYTYINSEGEMWVGNYEYETQVNFCPVTGKEAPVKVEPKYEKT